jgi:hypothetical protein
MKKGIITEIDWPYIGAVLANEGSEEQVQFFKAMAKEMRSWGTQHQVEFQLADVNKELTKEEKEIFSMLSFEDEK